MTHERKVIGEEKQTQTVHSTKFENFNSEGQKGAPCLISSTQSVIIVTLKQPKTYQRLASGLPVNVKPRVETM